MRQRSGWMFLAAVAIAVTAAAQPAPPTFRAGTQLVQVDVVVRDKTGPSTGLTKEDFTVLDNGKPQKIAVFFVRSSSLTSAPALRRAAPLPPGAVSNRPDLLGEAPGTDTVLLLDQKNTQRSDQEYAIERIVKFIEKRRATDRIGIYTFGKNGMQSVQELTDDPELLRRAVSSLQPQEPLNRFYDPAGLTELAELEIIDRVKDAKRALEVSARHLAKIPGRKNLIWISSSFPLVIPPGAVGQGAAALFRVNFTPDMEEAARVLNDSNVALYAVDPRGLLGDLSGLTGLPGAQGHGNPRAAPVVAARSTVGPPSIDTMNMLARLTGGQAFYNGNGVDESIETAVEDGELTYTLGFYPSQDSKDQDVHNLKVKVAKAGVRVRYRENYSTSATLAALNTRPAMEQLITDPLDATQIELIVETEPDQAHPGSFKVRVSFDLHDVNLAYRDAFWVGMLDVSFAIEGSKTVRTFTRRISIRGDDLRSELEQPVEVESSVALEGPNGVLCIAAQDQATGAAGSIRVRLEKK